MLKQASFQIGSVTLCFAAAALFAFGYNLGLIRELVKILSEMPGVKIGFIFSVPFLLVSFFNFVFVLLSARFMQKTALVLLILLSAPVSYAGFQYNVVFDDDMFMNVLETNLGEAASYLNLSLITWLLGLGVLPAALIWKLSIRKEPFSRSLLKKTFSAGLSTVVIGVIAMLYYPDYASTVRNNTILKKMVVPNYALENIYVLLKHRYDAKRPHKFVGIDAVQKKEETEKRKDLIVLIVGETQRAANYAFGGYARDTNAFTRARGVTYYKNVTSCGTATAASVPCMFSFLMREGYSKGAALSQDNLIDVVARAGVGVWWIDNDDGCKDVCAKADYTDVREKYRGRADMCGLEGCYDDIVAEELESRLTQLPVRDSLIVLHMMGSHGPNYYKRYPGEFRKFAPDCARSDIQNCSRDELVNTYDNTIYYEDHVIARIIDMLQAQKKRWNIALLFMSDHGESLGENGLYLHGMPYALAPPEQTRIPFMTWLSPAFYQHEDGNIDPACLARRAEEEVYSHDNLPHMILGLLDIETSLYDRGKDPFRSCREERPEKR